ncbi:helix-turn-helix domain-containing protein [Paraprevotella xylaniphila]
MGTSPCLYIQNRRIKRAQTLLLTTNMTITQVAERVGIYSPAQFTRLFAKIAGCKPKDYRNKLLDCCY